MQKILLLAWRNLLRNKRRTFITMGAIAFGLALLIVSSALGDGAHHQMIRWGVANQAGDVVVQGKGYQAAGKVEITVPDTEGVVSTLKHEIPEARIVRRVFFQGLLTSPRSAVGVGLVGVEPTREAEIGTLDEKIVEGRYLSEGDPRGIVLGKTLAKTLGVGIGDKVVLMTQAKGEIENVLFRVTGLFETGMDELDGFYAHIPLARAQETLNLGHDVTQISLHLPGRRDAHAVAAQLARALEGRPVEVLPWQEALPELYEYVVLDDGGLYVMILIIAIVVAFGILNTILMSVLERTRELGVMLSLGMTPLQVGGLILWEALLLGVVSVGVGSGIGALLSWPLIVSGVDLSRVYGTSGNISAGGVPLDMTIYGDLSPAKVLLFAGITLGLTLLAALYPTWRAARLHPIEAIHHH